MIQYRSAACSGACSAWSACGRMARTQRRIVGCFVSEGGGAMSGHSKWHQIRRQKGVNDARRGQLFTRLGRELVVAVREGGGGDPDANFRLRMAVQRARAANMP